MPDPRRVDQPQPVALHDPEPVPVPRQRTAVPAERRPRPVHRRLDPVGGGEQPAGAQGHVQQPAGPLPEAAVPAVAADPGGVPLDHESLRDEPPVGGRQPQRLADRRVVGEPGQSRSGVRRHPAEHVVAVHAPARPGPDHRRLLRESQRGAAGDGQQRHHHRDRGDHPVRSPCRASPQPAHRAMLPEHPVESARTHA